MRRDERMERELFKSTGTTSGINFDKYDDIPVETSGDAVPDPIVEFSVELLGAALMENVTMSGYKKPTPVQKYSIPIGNEGRDLMACAQVRIFLY
jgi:ATP-dependent RNA helicase DDX3X